MPSPFLRIVEDLERAQVGGTDEAFYAGENYFRLFGEVLAPIRAFCGANLVAVQLGPEDDDPITVFVLPLQGRGCDEILARFRFSLESVLKDCVTKAATAISSSSSDFEEAISMGGATRQGESEPDKLTVFSRQLDDAFDLLRNAADLRDFLLKAEGRLLPATRASQGDGLSLLIEV